MSTPKLPKNLPALPPVPEGYDRWEYRPKYDSGGEPVGAPFGAFHKLDKDGRWDWFFSEGRLGLPEEKCHGICSHYIVAVRDPKPSKSKSIQNSDTPKKRKGRVVAKRAVLGIDNIIFVSGPPIAAQSPVFVLPADAASVEQMVEQMARAADDSGDGWMMEQTRKMMRAALAAIGIKAKKEGAK